MTTIVNNPTPVSNNGGYGLLIGVLVLVVFSFLFLYFGLPAIRQMRQSQFNIPAPQINVPDKVDINVKSVN